MDTLGGQTLGDFVIRINSREFLLLTVENPTASVRNLGAAVDIWGWTRVR
jgi:hypothetical protein